MSAGDEQYFVYENRVASFRGPQPVTKGRVSSASSRAPKALHWPHKAPSPVTLAKAGFFFKPHPQSPDNVVCFLCAKSLDGWEEHDNPLEEHLKHSPTCGWAITAAIEAGLGNYGKVHPLDPFMVEARKATFAGRWPYESKKGFKCKTKKLVEAGWKYTPSLDADDMATCTYCQLALEGWESDDNPFDEHYRREPNCPFFALISQYPAPKKTGRTKAVRPSKASRLSVQSVATVATTTSDLVSAADITADHDDSVMTTASMARGGKKTAKGRKAATAKGRKTKAKKDEAVEILEDDPHEQEPPPQKSQRGRKRPSDDMEDSVLTNAEATAPKRRATRARGSNAVNSSTTSAPVPDTDMVDVMPAKPPTGRKKARASTTKTARKVSQSSIRSQASTASLRANIPDDDEIDRQLEADLERYGSDVEDLVSTSNPERPKAAAPIRGCPKKTTTTRKTSAQRATGQSGAYAMFDPTPVEPDEAEIEAEFEALQAEMAAEQPAATEGLAVPKRGRKTGTRKASKQVKEIKESAPDLNPTEQAIDNVAQLAEPIQDPVPEEGQQAHQRPDPEREPEPEPAVDPDASTATVITKPALGPTEKRGRGRPPKKSTSSQAGAQGPEHEQLSEDPAQSKVQTEWPRSRESPSAPKSSIGRITRKPVPVSSESPAPVVEPAAAAPTPAQTEKALPAQSPSASRLPYQPATPRAHAARSGLASQPIISPSRTPQSSDAENRPPSLQPAASVIPRRVVLAPVSATPMRSSPSKRNVIAGLQSTTPWRPADLDLLFSPSSHDDDKENGVAKLLRRGSELTSPEKRMTVEEWIYHNAGLAEQKLKHECEAMVAAFEREGNRAMRVLEGLVLD
ncbi:hypothetical protein VTK56DRAFT_1146 [Thermocarpiscus australiensis]